MDYYEYLNRLHKLLREAQDRQPLNLELGALAAETHNRLVADTPIVFAEPAPGYMLIGVEGQEALFQHPGLAAAPWSGRLAGCLANLHVRRHGRRHPARLEVGR